MEHPLASFNCCPKCGSKQFAIVNRKAKRCISCGFVYYFNPSSATVAFILNGKNELLVCRRAKDPAQGTLDLPGGFIDMRETAEEGIVREVFEETGLIVNEAIYQFSLPNVYVYSGSLLSLNINTFIVECNTFQTFHIVLPILTDDNGRTGERHRQFPTLTCKLL
ncbi:Bifunctional NMN adenylyltransferase/Nudix hydrolase [termite gut metagenome]|uniref:Bifunctional NMN adenylyltransferase/Nudix hydrolase n=1 Tax=termite gut metagenome TaxID=433724 RepID=A0A5J4PU03_9ZZZZ